VGFLEIQEILVILERKCFLRHDNAPKSIVKVIAVKRPLGRRSGENRFLLAVQHVPN